MKYLIIATIFLSIATISNARLGETPDECDRRYGTPITCPEPNRERAIVENRVYLRNGIRVEVEFQNEEDGVVRANFVIYSKPGNYMNTPLSSTELHTFLSANSNSRTWDEQDDMEEALQTEDSYTKTERIRSSLNSSTWMRSDKKAVAVYTSSDNILLIGTVAGAKRFISDPNSHLKGF